MNRNSHPVWILLLLSLCLLLACRAPWLPPHETTPSDTSAKQLDLQLHVYVLVDARGNPQELTIDPNFMYQKIQVQFQNGEQVVCGGIILNSEIGSEVPLPKDGSPVVCNYEQGGSRTEISFSPPKNLVVSSPQPNAKVKRSSMTIVSFMPDTGHDVSDVNVNCSDLNNAHQTTQQTNTNASSIQCDSSSFIPGNGIIFLQRDYEVKPTSGFHSLDLLFVITAKIPIQWI